MGRKETNKKIIIYLVKKLGESIEGKKKIMKLFFILEHINPDNNKTLDEPFLGNEFFIYHYGVYSETVMKDIYRLVNDKTLEDGFPLRLNEDFDENKLGLDQRITEKLDKIIKKFGRLSGYDLERKTLIMLGLDLTSKREFMGFNVREIIKKSFC